jgi:ribosomal protein L7Ae-like RNA K-turn-binding protein
VPLLEFYNMLGLCMRAGACVYGGAQCEKAVKAGRVKLVILDSQVSDNTRKHFNDICAYRNIVCIEMNDNEGLGRSIGKDNIKIIGVTDNGFSMNVYKKFKEGSDHPSES